MAAKAKKTKTVDKWRKKKYFSVMASKLFQERELGHVLAYEPDSLNGRSITTNLMALTGNMRKQGINITFKIDRVKGDTAYTFLEKYQVTPANIKRKVRRSRDKIDASFDCVTKDNKSVRIKPLVITAVKTSKPVRSDLKRAIIRFVKDSAKDSDYDTLLRNVMDERLQKDIAKAVSKIVPVRFVTIRFLKLLGDFKGAPDDGESEEDNVAEAESTDDKATEDSKDNPVEESKKTAEPISEDKSQDPVEDADESAPVTDKADDEKQETVEA